MRVCVVVRVSVLTPTQHTHTHDRNPCLIRILESAHERAVHKKGGQESKASDWESAAEQGAACAVACACERVRARRDRDIPEVRESGELGRRQARQPVAGQIEGPVGHR